MFPLGLYTDYFMGDCRMLIMQTDFSIHPKENPWYDWVCQYHGRMGELCCEYQLTYVVRLLAYNSRNSENEFATLNMPSSLSSSDSSYDQYITIGSFSLESL